MFRRAAPLLIAAAIVAGCGSDDGGEEQGAMAAGFDEQRAFADLRAQVEIGPRPAGSPASREAARLIAAGLREAGVEDVRIQHPHLNVVGRLPGTEPGTVVVGAHHDTKNQIPHFQGANDSASGVGVVLELARSLPRPLPGPSIAFALFDAEEARGDRPFELDGLRGSSQYVRYANQGGRQGSPPLNEIRAMVLFDLVGDCDLQIPLEQGSDPRLYRLFAEAATEATGSAAPFQGRTTLILDDHVPFIEAGVPAVDLIDFTYGPGPTPGEWWHTPKDTLDKVCPESLDAVGEAALRAIPEIR
jgi:glutaminyl-peptide cyclotransferase